MPLGTLGTGKSTFLNCCLGSYGFETSEEPEGCTQNFSIQDTDVATLIDSPGLNDPRMPIGTWINALRKVGGKEISLCLLFIMQKFRPDTLDKTNILVMMEALREINPENVAVVFTHCDENPSFTKEKGVKYMDSLLKTMNKDQYNVPFQVTAERIFLFKGEETS